MGKTDCNIYDKATISSMYKEFLQISKKTNSLLPGKTGTGMSSFPAILTWQEDKADQPTLLGSMLPPLLWTSEATALEQRRKHFLPGSFSLQNCVSLASSTIVSPRVWEAPDLRIPPNGTRGEVLPPRRMTRGPWTKAQLSVLLGSEIKRKASEEGWVFEIRGL